MMPPETTQRAAADGDVGGQAGGGAPNAPPAAHPILFSAPMVRAILAGRKSMTRRILKQQPRWHDVWEDEDSGAWMSSGPGESGDDPIHLRWQVGNYLWVREGFSGPHEYDNLKLSPVSWDADGPIWYWADGNPSGGDWTKPKPSIHMPRWASRITLEVTAVRVERLQNINDADALAEGIEPPETEREDRDWSICPRCGGTGLYTRLGSNLGVMPDCDCFECDTPSKRFRHLWNSLHGPEAWDANPWVSVTSFVPVVAIVPPRDAGENGDG